MKKLKKESIRQEQKKHVLQQIEICLKRMLVTTGASCSVIVSEGFKAELDETFDHDWSQHGLGFDEGGGTTYCTITWKSSV